MRPYGYRRQDYALRCPCCPHHDSPDHIRAARKRARQDGVNAVSQALRVLPDADAPAKVGPPEP